MLLDLLQSLGSIECPEMVRVKESESQLAIIGSSELLRRYCRESNLILQDLNTIL